MTAKRPHTLLPKGLRASTLRVGELDLLVLSYEEGRGALPSSLSKAERAVADALLQGKSNQQIADAGGTAMRTVANQVASVLRKCGVVLWASRAENRLPTQNPPILRASRKKIADVCGFRRAPYAAAFRCSSSMRLIA